MRYGVTVPQTGRFVGPEAHRELARAAEDLGFDSLWVSDHVIVPENQSYVPEVMGDPLAVLAFLAAVTSRVRIGTSVLILPYRDPVVTASFLSTVDVLSGGRLEVGVGIGWLPEEFAAVGVPFAERAARTDEAIEVWRNLWETETSSFSGRWTTYTDMRMFPKAAKERDGTIPITVGGNTAPAIGRAARAGDGWHPINLSAEDLAAGVDSYRTACAGNGREPGPVMMRWMPGGRVVADQAREPLTGSAEEQASDIREWAEAGLDELMLSVRASSVADLVERWGTFMGGVASRV